MRSPLPGAGVALGLQSGGRDRFPLDLLFVVATPCGLLSLATALAIRGERLSAGVFFDVVPHVAPSVPRGTGGWVWSQQLREPFNARAHPSAFAGALTFVGMRSCIYLLSSLGL